MCFDPLFCVNSDAKQLHMNMSTGKFFPSTFSAVTDAMDMNQNVCVYASLI